VQLQGLWHRYDGATEGAWTLQGIDLSLRQGELVGLLGPSGCGKTTLLRLIAGFERPTRGSISIDGRQVAGPQRWLEPERRGVGMVFQDYALFPHLSAWGNACFGLRRGADTSRASWLLELLGLGGLEQRYPHELSGGQRQRLALARALAPAPAVVLLDEPFSNLDVEVRLRLRSELPGVLSQCGTSGLIVTHDPEEALAICDRVGVMEGGLLHQCASPRDLVQHPASPFVGRFVLQGNALPVTACSPTSVNTALGLWQLAELGDLSGQDPGQLTVLVNPEALQLEADAAAEAVVLGREFLGREWLVQVQQGELRLRLRLPLEQDWQRGQHCRVQRRLGAKALLYPGALPLLAQPRQ
jgi:iron(III) transport system ATP-binding protein